MQDVQNMIFCEEIWMEYGFFKYPLRTRAQVIDNIDQVASRQSEAAGENCL